MKKVYVFLAEGFEEMEAVTPIDLLRRAGVDAVPAELPGKRAQQKAALMNAAAAAENEAMISEIPDIAISL